MPTKLKKVYYRVQALQDGAIWFAVPTRKPSRRRTSGDPDIDEGGIYSWYLEEPSAETCKGFSDWGKDLWHWGAWRSVLPETIAVAAHGNVGFEPL